MWKFSAKDYCVPDRLQERFHERFWPSSNKPVMKKQSKSFIQTVRNGDRTGAFLLKMINGPKSMQRSHSRFINDCTIMDLIWLTYSQVSLIPTDSESRFFITDYFLRLIKKVIRRTKMFAFAIFFMYFTI